MMNMNFEKVIKIFEKHGHKNYSNISDYWFGNEHALKDILKKYSPWYYPTFELLVRWKSEIGKACQSAVREHIESVQEKWINNNNVATPVPSKLIIEFSQFSFEYNDKYYSLDDFAKSFNTSHVGGLTDLRGIDLSGIVIRNCKIANCFFANANFDKTNFEQVFLYNCNFVKASFVNARLVSVKMDKESAFSNANFTNDFRNPENQSLKKYIDWYLYVNKQLDNYNSLRLHEKFFLIFNIVLTKYWTSFAVLAFNSVLLILAFALVYYFNHCNLIFNRNIPQNFLSMVYYSVSIFVSFGFGDIIPKTNFMQLIITSELILGYFVLGIFVILITRKLDSKY
ncbi:MAG TPA: hypothetical protein DD381_05180 [Lentisphaeria bacterium]|nr:MAG: hypothetical protein A2X47_06235 [Lentisphaerae bacterium GWF2_38_69]HBM15724.1 hypothetical protein [Lentisphaeria bacterium]